MSFEQMIDESEQTQTRGDHDEFLGELADHLFIIDHPPVPSLLTAVRARAAEAYGAYFCGDSSIRSYIGNIDDSKSMPEGEISDFVRDTHRELYERLGGMPLESGHLDDSEEPPGVINDGCELNLGSSPGSATLVAGSENSVSPAANAQQVAGAEGTAMPTAAANEVEDIE